jgi:hypothetical protein
MVRPLGTSYDQQQGLAVIEIGRDVLVQLRPAAKCREMSVQRLAVTLLETIARERLTDAVLDDQACSR